VRSLRFGPVRIVCLLLAVALLAFPAVAGAKQLRVVVVPGLELDDLEPLSARGAVGLLVPGAGPETSSTLARAALVRGKVRNSLRGGLPSGPPLVTVENAPRVPRGPAIVLALPSGGEQPNDRRYPVAVLADGYRGLLRSDSTRLPGLVSIADIAPTALRTERALGSSSSGDPIEDLHELDRRIDENGDARLPASLIAAAIILVLALLFPRAAVLGFATGLAANLLLGVAGISSPWYVLPTMVLAVAGLAALLALVIRSPVAIGLVLVAVIAAYLVAMAVDTATVALSPLGPTQNSRFYGVSNLLETMLAVPALAGAALVVRRLGWVAFAAVGLLALVTIAGSRFGADGGGAAVLAAGFVVLAVLLSGGGRRRWLAGLGLGLAALGAVALDALVGPSTHVGRSLAEGGVFSDFAARVELSWERATSSPLTAFVVAAAILALGLLVARGPRRALPLAFAAAIAVSLVVNDSPGDVAAGGLVGYLALQRFDTSPRLQSRENPP
jgi:hypothetical protein